VARWASHSLTSLTCEAVAARYFRFVNKQSSGRKQERNCRKNEEGPGQRDRSAQVPVQAGLVRVPL